MEILKTSEAQHVMVRRMHDKQQKFETLFLEHHRPAGAQNSNRGRKCGKKTEMERGQLTVVSQDVLEKLDGLGQFWLCAYCNRYSRFFVAEETVILV